MRRRLTFVEVMTIFVICIIVGVLYYIDNDFQPYMSSEVKEMRRFVNYHRERLIDYRSYPQFNNEREILNRMFASDEGVKEAVKRADVKFKYDGEYFAEVKVTQGSYGYIYKRALKKANKYISKNNIKNKKKKNDILNSYLVSEYTQLKDATVTYNFEKKVSTDQEASYVSVLIPTEKENNNYIIYSSLLGGLREAMVENPCDYLILDREYKFYVDLDNILDGYIEEIKHSDREDLSQCRDIINTINFKNQNFNNDNIFDIIQPQYTKMLFSDSVKIRFNGNIYGEAYRIYNKNSFNARLEKNKKAAYYYKLKDYEMRYGSIGITREYFDYTDPSDEDSMYAVVDYEETVDKNGESTFKLIVSKEKKEEIYDNILGGLLSEVKTRPCKYYDEKEFAMYRDFDRQLEGYVHELNDNDSMEKYKKIIKSIFNKKDFKDVENLIVPSYIIDKKKNKVIVNINPYPISEKYFEIVEILKEHEKMGRMDKVKDKKAYAYDTLGRYNYDMEYRDFYDTNISLYYEEIYDDSGEKHYRLVVNEKDKEKIFKIMMDNLDEAMEYEPYKYFE
ncbi:hypothetical protein [Anaerofustis sp.]|uniref:hypothetical protein n=1 Tax=Anaerofustis sp. TaxID=1872517 RepID=UPI0025BA6DF9|nr:hypothetical protein [Anaerofustis sp.]